MKLGKRLKRIDQMVTADYTHIWDCCCDHGYLGAHLLSRQAADNIHFVDIVPKLISKIENTLQQRYPNSPSAWTSHCLDVAQLPLEQYQGTHLIIIAGIGGDLMIRLLSDLHQKHPTLTVDFLLCPVHHQFALRQQLIGLDFSLKNEALVEDKQRFYEIILASSASNQNSPINPVGDKIWQSVTTKQADVAKRYLAATLNHYRRIQQGNAINVNNIISAYHTVTL